LRFTENTNIRPGEIILLSDGTHVYAMSFDTDNTKEVNISPSLVQPLSSASQLQIFVSIEATNQDDVATLKSVNIAEAKAKKYADQKVKELSDGNSCKTIYINGEKSGTVFAGTLFSDFNATKEEVNARFYEKITGSTYEPVIVNFDIDESTGTLQWSTIENFVGKIVISRTQKLT